MCEYYKKWKRIKECDGREGCCPHYEEDNKNISYTSMYPYELKDEGCTGTDD